MTATATQFGFEELGTPLFDATFVVLDLETTGLQPGHDRITEVGAVKVRGGEVLGELRTFVRPDRPIPPAVTAVTGITDAMVRDAPSVATVVPVLREFLGSAVFVAHNARFDLSFLRAAWAVTGAGELDPVVVDTARLARRLLADEVRNCRLETLARHLRARTLPEHRALADARATVDVLHGLIERAGTLGATTLEDLRDLSRSSSDRAFRRIDLVRDAPSTCGVYRFLDPRGEVLYVGKATDLRSRLRTYFGQDRRRRVADLVRECGSVTWTPTPTLLEAEVRELREIHRHRPRYNRRSNRPEAAVHVALTREAFPRLSVVRSPGPGHRSTLGPIPSRQLAQHLVEALQDAYPLRTCTPRLRRAQDHAACVLKELGRCGAPCDGTQTGDDYDAVVAAVETAWEDPTELLERLRTRMRRFGQDGRFERAGEARSRLHTAARAVHGARRRDALAGVDELVVRRELADACEVAVVRRGRLAGTARLDRRAGDAEALAWRAQATLDDCAGPWQRDDAEEIELVLDWLERPDTRVVAVEGVWDSRIAGGAALHAAVEEARRLGRQLRRDRQVLNGAKVVRRAEAPLVASG
ncbi:DEDD exonuclease domain-containing protein [Egicoccus halophilus]|uniref:DNA polymerase III subunit epsilon n=1 Tax=Egicoccus halophilus TaxID=1670830 RepID=A0A8J3EU97_9ACTN|nr:DEDD exonuclease domain-containing protein [Egicoccus halophilus]GGI07247.1 DNA polymerase III subunit epsilon [Egicoccus halophilus]